MRIAIVTWSFDEHQGISRCVVELSARLAREHEVHVFAAEVAAPGHGGVQVHRVALRWPQPHVNDYDFAWRAGRQVQAGGFDIVHAHFPVWCRTHVYTCHGLARMALRSFRHFPLPAREDVSLRRMARWYAQVPLHTQAVRRAGPIMAAVSGKVAREVAEDSRRPVSEIRVVPNGTDLRRFHPGLRGLIGDAARAEWGLGADRFVLLWVGNHLRHKGLRHAIDALQRLPERALLLVVGADSAASVPELAGPIAALQAAGRLRFLPSQLLIERCYAAADALLFPSLYESFGLVVLEAMACGLPVLTARTVAFGDEAVVDGHNGLLVDAPWQAEAMAQRLRRLMDDAAWRHGLGQSGRRTAEGYTWDVYFNAYQRLYLEATEPVRHADGQRRHAT